MLGDAPVSGMIAVSDYNRAKEFYGGTLGMEVQEVMPGVVTFLKSGGGQISIYQSSENAGKSPATVAGFAVGDVKAVVRQLNEHGITMERYDGMDQDDDGVTTGEGPASAWFKDPDGNILGIYEGA